MGDGQNRKRLHRSRNASFGGVLAGIAEYLDVDPVLVRVLFAAITVFTGFVPGIVFYFLAWAIMPPAE